MKYQYDPEVDALSIRFLNAPSAESDEVREDVIFDYDVKKRLISIELLNASKILPGSFSKKAVSARRLATK